MVPTRPASFSAILLLASLLGCDELTSPDIHRNPDDDLLGPGGILTIGTLGGEYGEARGINDHNEVVGVAENSDGDMRAFRWKEGEIEELEGLGGTMSGAYGINDAGWIVGEAENEDGNLRAVLWIDEDPVDLGTLGGGVSVAMAVSEDGRIVGLAQNLEGDFRPFTWSENHMQALPLPSDSEASFASADGVNDRGNVVGSWAGGFGQQALLWEEDGVIVLESACGEAAAFDINQDEQIVGGGLLCPIAPELMPLLWAGPGTSEYLEPIGGFPDAEGGAQTSGSANAISDAGQIVGWSDGSPDESPSRRVTLWRDGGGEVVNVGGEPPLPQATDVNEGKVAAGRSGGQPTLFATDDRAGMAVESRGILRKRRTPAPSGDAAGTRIERELGTHLRGSRATEAWAEKLCAHGRVRGPATVAGILAGCDVR